MKRHFGLIGGSLEHSFSRDYFGKKFVKDGLSECRYDNYPLASIADFPELIKNRAFDGLNVTIPYKESIIPFLDELDPVAAEVGAVNTIAFENGKTKGYNTDVVGFRKSIGPFLEDYHSKALVLGTGGAAKAVAHVLRKLEMAVVFVSRNPKEEDEIGYDYLTDKVFREYLVVVNTTPLGTYPDVDATPMESLSQLSVYHVVYDLIYNPVETRLLRDAKAMGAKVKNGLEMLEIQAEESWKIWQVANATYK